MKPSSFILMALLFSGSYLQAQKKEITLRDIWTDNTFKEETLEALRPSDNSVEYTVLKQNKDDKDGDTTGSSIEAYSYKTGKNTQTLVNSKEIEGLDHFDDYQFNQHESKVLLAKDKESIYRRSTKAHYYIYNLNDKSLHKLADEKIRAPSFSPGGHKVAYAYENNLYIKNLDNDETTQITDDGETNCIINGTTDWVYEEEFAFTKAYAWNEDGTKIGFLRFDESEVPQITMELYGTYPHQLYPEPYHYKYPKAGRENSAVSVHLYDVASQKSEKVNLKKDYEYLPRLKWTKSPKTLSIQGLNRHQNDLDLIFINANKNSAKVVFNEKDEDYIDITDNLTFLADNSFLWTSEKSNWNHIYHYNKRGKLIKQITEGNWAVTDFYGFDPESERLYFQSTETGSVNRGVYSIKLSGDDKNRLSQNEGTNSAEFNKDYGYFINTYSSLDTPKVYTVNQAKDGKILRTIKDNHELKEKLEDYELADKKITSIAINGNNLNMWMIKPPDFTPNKAYPLLLYQYSGPGSQEVSNSFFTDNDYWYEMLAEKGYIIAVVDGRGTGFRGADFKKATQLELGKYELEDQIAAAKKLGQRNYIDKNRIGIWGWSFGGFMASNALFQSDDVFKMAIAVAPVTSWRFYDTVYTERYMNTPEENPEGYDANSPITHVDEFNDDSHFLLLHGSGDDNVHLQNSMQMIEALIQADKDFDWNIYPDNDHSIKGGNTRHHLYGKMTNFIEKNL